MKPSLRFLLPCLLAGSALLLLSGCGEPYDRYGGREYHHHAYAVTYREGRPYDYYGGPYYAGHRYETWDHGDRYHDYDHGDRYEHYDRHPHYVENTHVVVDTRHGSAPYAGHTHSGYTPRQGTRPPPPATVRSSTNVNVNVSAPNKPKGKDKKKDPYPPRP